MQDIFGYTRKESSACGVGFIVSRKGKPDYNIVRNALDALCCFEHRGATAADGLTGDGAGIMTDIPFDILGHQQGTVAVAMIFLPQEKDIQRRLLDVFETVFDLWGMKILEYRNVPTDPSVLGSQARESLPHIIQAVIERPYFCNTDFSFDKLLYIATKMTLTKQRKISSEQKFFISSLSANTIVYKGLCKSELLDRFYLDLQNPLHVSRFAMIHRRFSTNTSSTWDKAQPMRLIAHNGEINTIGSNKSWAISREKTMGLPKNELVSHGGISDSGSLNEMVEALMYRSSLPSIQDAMALMIPPADQKNDFYKFWGRTMEPWDGPALVTFSDGHTIGARLDRNGFRPCRWAMTEEHFLLSSEAGAFYVPEEKILAKGSLRAGNSVAVNINTGAVDFKDPSQSPRNFNTKFDPRLIKLGYLTPDQDSVDINKKFLFNYTEEEVNKVLIPMIAEGKEPIGSMGDTARLAILSEEPRSFFDFFFQTFAQVTNPPLDFIREKMVTDLSVYLGVRPNIFAKKELIPPPEGIELASPVLSLGQFEYIKSLPDENVAEIDTRSFDITYKREFGAVGFQQRLQTLRKEVVEAVKNGASVVILSDRKADWDNLPIPVLIALRVIIDALDEAGARLTSSLVVDTAQVRTTHQLAATVSFGAAAVCPYLALELARKEESVKNLSPDEKELNLLKALESGLMKVMSKMGISVFRSYQSSKLFTIIGLDKEFCKKYFKGVPSLMGGYDLEAIAKGLLEFAKVAEAAQKENKLINTYQFREFPKGTKGEKHSMTAPLSKIVHKLVREKDLSLDNMALYDEYLKAGQASSPVNVRDLLEFRQPEKPLELSEIEPAENILKTFGSGAMSFGAISAEAQRDIFLAMEEIGGRSNSGEGGENPYYFSEGITANVKQVASGRFGVTAMYLVSGKELQIKVAQGAKPGEGGQLMGVKVNEDIARARHSLPEVDLISPPPLHDIYSIEDLKELIYELKQVKPGAKVSVKLVAGANIGTIAIGVAKAGADIIHISGNNGGTGAAALTSMKHAGLPFEFGLLEAHNALAENNLREKVIIRVDGGLHTGKDIVMAAIMGAEEFDFGKLLLVAQGCVMARVCEKNTCPAGIATHDPKFKARYSGTKDHIVQMIRFIAEDVRRHLAVIGYSSLKQITGKTELFETNRQHLKLISDANLDLSFVLRPSSLIKEDRQLNTEEPVSSLNRQILDDVINTAANSENIFLSYNIRSTDKAVTATLSGWLAETEHHKHLNKLGKADFPKQPTVNQAVHLSFNGSAGQGFGVFMVKGLKVKLFGEANDSVCKSMSGGKAVIRPSMNTVFNPAKNTIIGNCALYGATGGILYVNGIAGDRFAVRNSGATAIVEGTGLHACEYMTNGNVIILGKVEHNVGSGMTGGRIFLYENQEGKINTDYIKAVALNDDDYQELKELLTDYQRETKSPLAGTILGDWDTNRLNFRKYLPVKVALLEEKAGKEVAV